MPPADCVFCNLAEKVKDYERYKTWHHNGWPIYKVVPLEPVTEGHVLFVPAQHVATAASNPLVAGQVFAAAADYAADRCAEWDTDFNLITSRGEAATQTVFHLHVHYVPRRENDGLQLPWSLQQERAAMLRANRAMLKREFDPGYEEDPYQR